MEKRHNIEYQGQPPIIDLLTYLLMAASISTFCYLLFGGNNSVSNFINNYIEVRSLLGILILIVFIGICIAIIFLIGIPIRKVFTKRKYIIIKDEHLIINDELINYKDIKMLELKELYNGYRIVIGYTMKLKWNNRKLNMSVTTDQKRELNLIFDFYKDLEEAYKIFIKNNEGNNVRQQCTTGR
jgi:hypothetical protein